MYPKPEDDLRGWDVHAIGAGAGHHIAHADESIIAWGASCTSGELGQGEGGKKSSARPVKVDSLEGVKVAQVACGPANTVLLVDGTNKVVGELEEWTPAQAPVAEEAGASVGAGKGKGGAKRKADAPKGGKAKKGK